MGSNDTDSVEQDSDAVIGQMKNLLDGAPSSMLKAPLRKREKLPKGVDLAVMLVHSLRCNMRDSAGLGAAEEPVPETKRIEPLTIAPEAEQKPEANAELDPKPISVIEPEPEPAPKKRSGKSKQLLLRLLKRIAKKSKKKPKQISGRRRRK